MAIFYAQQRRPLTTEEVDDNEMLSARFYTRAAQNGNNIFAYCAKPMLLMQHWPGGFAFQSAGSERDIQWPRLQMPSGFTDIRFAVGWNRTAGAGTLSARLYARRYLQTARPSTTEYSTLVETTSDTHVFTKGRISDCHPVAAGDLGFFLYLHLFTTMGTSGRILTVKAWPEP